MHLRGVCTPIHQPITTPGKAPALLPLQKCLNILFNLLIIMPATAKFEVYQDKTGGYRFRLKASNGEIIAVGESYKSKRSCEQGIESVKKNAPKAKIEDLTE